MAKVRITKAPVGGGKQKVRITSLPNQMAPNWYPGSNMSAPSFEVARTIKPVPREEANIEAEKGETVLMPDKGGLPAHFNIGGNRHSNGGTPLNVTKDSFVFSDTKKMRIKDPEILAEFGKSKGSYTPADLAKKYDINKYRKILQDPDSDSIMVSTAEKMISNYNLKLAKLALVQESKKGFPQGIPEVAMPFMATYNVSPDQILPFKQPEEQAVPQMRYGGSLPKAQQGNNPVIPGQDPEALKQFYQEQMRKRQLRLEFEEFNKKKAHNEWLQKRKEYELSLKKLETKKQVDDKYQTLEQLSGKTYLPLGNIKRGTGFDQAYDQYVDAVGKYSSLFPSPIIDTSGVSPYTPYQNLPINKIPVNSTPAWPKPAPAVPVATTAPVVSDNSAIVYLKEQGYSDEQITQILSTKKYGGTLAKMDPGGNPPLTPAQIAAMKGMKPANKPVTPTKAKTVAKGKGPTVSPYGDADTEAFLKKFGVSPEDMVYDPIGHQSQSTLGLTDQQVYDKWRKGNPKFIAEFEKDGNKFDPNSPEDMKQYEKFHKDYTYNGIYNALLKKGVKEDVAKKKAQETADKLSFVEQPGQINGKDQPKVVNAADQQWGNYHRTRREFNFEDPAVAEEVVAETKKPVTEAGPKAGAPAQYSQANPNAPWWIQDVINTASAAGTRLGLKKYLPWAPPVHLETPRATFFDPTRELAANAEQMQIGTQGAGLFAGPQAFNSRFSQIQGAGARNAANVLSNYHNKNVGVANQFENIRTGIMNKEAMINADSARKLYDQTTVANQQFDNAKRQANDQLRASYVNAITNRAQAQTLNELYPHYQVDPMSGGFTEFDRGSEMITGRGNKTLAEQAAEVNAAAAQAGWSPRDMIDYIGRGSKQDRTRDSLYEYDDNAYDDRADYLRQRNGVVPMTRPYGYTG